jgi:hypothetical protein
MAVYTDSKQINSTFNSNSCNAVISSSVSAPILSLDGIASRNDVSLSSSSRGRSASRKDGSADYIGAV